MADSFLSDNLGGSLLQLKQMNDSAHISGQQEKLRILGVDPGSRIAGYAVIESRKAVPYQPRDFVILDAGAVKANPKLVCSERIGFLHEAFHELAAEWRPSICVMEKSFVGVNYNSSLRWGEARGALLSAFHRLRIPIAEVTPTRVKLAITGRGQAAKEDVALALGSLLQFKRGNLPYDVSDALAIALYYGLTYAFARVTGGACPMSRSVQPSFGANAD